MDKATRIQLGNELSKCQKELQALANQSETYSKEYEQLMDKQRHICNMLNNPPPLADSRTIDQENNKTHVDYWKDKLNTRVICPSGAGVFKNFAFNSETEAINGMVIKLDDGIMCEYLFHTVRGEYFHDRLLDFLRKEKVHEDFDLPVDQVANYIINAIVSGGAIARNIRERMLNQSSGQAKKFHDNCSLDNRNLSSVGQSGGNAYPPSGTHGCTAGAHTNTTPKSKEDA